MRYGLTHVLITLLFLVLLNSYCSTTILRLFQESKESALLEKTQLVASAIADQEVLNGDTVTEAVADLENLRVTRLIITDFSGQLLYDSLSDTQSGVYCLFPEVVQALEGNDVFTMRYHDGELESQAASPILSYNTLVGCVYLKEYDPEQGQLIRTMNMNIFAISLLLILILFLFSMISSVAFSTRLRKIMASIRIIREGNYDHKVRLDGRDELAVLGSEFDDLTTRLQLSEQQRRQFVSDASHELKTPLASIKLLSDSILQNDMDMETVREFVSDIGQEADRLNRMSQKLLSLTKASSDVGPAECEIVYVGPTLRRVVRMLSAIARQAHVTIHTDIRQDCTILIQEDDLYQIIFNLVENGIKYNLPEGHLYLTLMRQEDNAVLQIRDTGTGIPEQAIDHIFERFYRVDKARSRQTGGSGLGLAIVHDMIQRNRGSIRVESRCDENHGTTFTLEMPIFDVEEEE